MTVYFKNIKRNKIKIIFVLFIIIYILVYNIFINKIFFYKNIKNLKKTFKSPHIVIVFGTRPEAIKLIPLIKELKSRKIFDITTINTGQHRKMIKNILESLDLDNNIIDIELNMMKNNQSLTELTSRTILELEKIYSSIYPDAIIVQGDTTTSYAAALSAFYLKIPVFHVEAGLRTHNLYSPFPEEFNRVSIDEISTLFFASTEWAASNLLKENKDPKNIFVTGNTVVDALKLTLKKTSPSNFIKKLLKKIKLRCGLKIKCKIILLTCHRRENYFKPISDILKAVQKLLLKFNDIIIILPFHLNPNVRKSIQIGLPKDIYNKIIKGDEIKENNYLYFNRLILIQPLNYIDLIHLQSSSYFIMTDSGGIQEEGVSIGKPILILRENTERPEAVKAGSAKIVGTSHKKIFYFASTLLNNESLYHKMAQSHTVYGSGNSSIIISNIITNYFDNKNLPNKNYFIKLNYNNILNKYDNLIINDTKDIQYDLVIVLTVWKRNNLERQLIQVKRQSILKNKKTSIIIFQNFNHTNVNSIVNKWKGSDMFLDEVNITFINSPIETGYYGRFLAPLTSSVTNNAYFIICDDDIIWGDRYFENMIRVVDDGYLATRNGRILDKKYKGISPITKAWNSNVQICFNEDIEYDFGGHIWAGRISWLRKAWTHIPISIENCEDFWISAVLKAYYNISTRTPKCPCPEDKPINPDMCAATDKSSGTHSNAIIGNSFILHKVRAKINREIVFQFNYRPLIINNPNIVQKIQSKFFFGNLNHPLFNLNDSLWKNVRFWQ